MVLRRFASLEIGFLLGPVIWEQGLGQGPAPPPGLDEPPAGGIMGGRRRCSRREIVEKWRGR